MTNTNPKTNKITIYYIVRDSAVHTVECPEDREKIYKQIESALHNELHTRYRSIRVGDRLERLDSFIMHPYKGMFPQMAFLDKYRCNDDNFYKIYKLEVELDMYKTYLWKDGESATYYILANSLGGAPTCSGMYHDIFLSTKSLDEAISRYEMGYKYMIVGVVMGDMAIIDPGSDDPHVTVRKTTKFFENIIDAVSYRGMQPTDHLVIDVNRFIEVANLIKDVQYSKPI